MNSANLLPDLQHTYTISTKSGTAQLTNISLAILNDQRNANIIKFDPLSCYEVHRDKQPHAGSFPGTIRCMLWKTIGQGLPCARPGGCLSLLKTSIGNCRHIYTQAAIFRVFISRASCARANCTPSCWIERRSFSAAGPL